MSESKEVDPEKFIQAESSFHAGRLPARLNALQAAALIAGAMVGSGIFTFPGKVLGIMGSTVAALMLWVLGAILAAMAGMVYAEWGSRLPVSGGEAPLLEHAYPYPPRMLASVFSFTRVLLINPASNASIAVNAGNYLSAAFPNTFPELDGDDWYAKRIAAAIITVQTITCIPSNGLTDTIVAGVTTISLGTLSAFCTTGLVNLCGGIPGARHLDVLSDAHLLKGTSFNPGNWAAAFFKVMRAYEGFSNLSSALGEVKDPQRNVGRATCIGVGIVSSLYLMANISFFVTLKYEDIVRGDAKLAAVWGKAVFGDVGQSVVAFGIFLCASACNFVSLFSATRVAQATGEARLIPFPSFFASVHPKVQMPVNALLVHFVLAITLIFGPQGKTFWFLIDLVTYPSWVFYVLTTIGLLVVKKRTTGSFSGKDPNLKGVQVALICPILVIVIGMFIVIFPFFQPEMVLSSALGIAVMLFALVPYCILEVLPRLRAHRDQ